MGMTGEIGTALVALVLGSCLVAGYRSLQPSSPLVASPSVVNFGDLKAGAVVHRRVLLTNNTDRDLTVVSASTSCRCTTAKVPKTIRARQTASIEVGLGTVAASGSVEQSVSVALKGREDHPLVLPVLASVGPVVAAASQDDGQSCKISPHS